MSEYRKAWITYSLLRVLFFVVPFAALYALGLNLGFTMAMSGIIAAVIATLIAASLSMLVLSKPRERASESIHEWRNRDRTADDIEEDEALSFDETSEESESAESAAPAEPAETADDDAR